jgi:tight adherence protein C
VILFVVSVALATGLTVLFVGSMLTTRPAAIGRRLEDVRRLNVEAFTPAQQQRRQHRRETVEDLLEIVGRGIARHSGSAAVVAELLTHAGYRSARAPYLFWGIRVALMAGLAVFGFLTASVVGVAFVFTLLAALYLAAIGYVLPTMVIRSRARARQKEMTLALPDAIDLLVVCVEAGLGINQALLRVAQEIHHVSDVLSKELHLTNLEIRAGRPRNEALRNLTDRTGVEDVRGLMSTLVQAERFGTPVGPALRVHAEVLRDKRKQRAREAAAKTTIKLVFPLVFCIFPALFVVLIGPALIQIIEALSGV